MKNKLFGQLDNIFLSKQHWGNIWSEKMPKFAMWIVSVSKFFLHFNCFLLNCQILILARLSL